MFLHVKYNFVYYDLIFVFNKKKMFGYLIIECIVLNKLDEKLLFCLLSLTHGK